MNNLYKKQVALLIRIMPSLYRIEDFAVHGGTAINLFHKNMPRYSVDIDLTYIPIQERTSPANPEKQHRKIHTGHQGSSQARCLEIAVYLGRLYRQD